MARTPYVPGVPGDKILRAVGRYHLLTREQLTRLLYRPTSGTFVGEHLTALTRHGYLEMHRVPLTIPFGGTPGYWVLTEKGRRFVRPTMELPPRLHHKPSYATYYLLHTVELNDALIALELLARDLPGVTLLRVHHERLLKRRPAKVTLADGATVSVVPDAWIDLVLAGEPMGIALELDRGTERDAQWRRKVAGLVALGAGPYREAFAADSMTVAVIATGGAHRLAEIVRWTEQELADLGRRHWREFFWFTHAIPKTTDPRALYAAARWVRPFDQTPRPLIELPQGDR
ncbi:MAG: replication-relaxation family protein [Thermomicrobiales bacterium]